MLFLVGLVALLVFSIGGERFYARHPDAARMRRARVMFALAAIVTAMALVIEAVKWL